MKKLLLASALCLSLVSLSYAAPVHDWHDLDAIHKHVVQAVKEMAKARAANHYDMEGHGAKAEDLLKQAEVELKEAVQAAKNDK